MAKKRNAKKKGTIKNAVETNKVPISNNINSEAIAAALSTTNLPVLLKVCRLCETKDGPFLNIFDIDKIIAKKIEDVMPFVVAENDHLPHKICFRCSAKVEELHEFIQKCVKTQINLRRAIGNKTPLPTKVKHRTLWEEKLNESNISNDDLCDALIKKAMESIKEPLKSISLKDDSKTVNKKPEKYVTQEPIKNEIKGIVKCHKARSSPTSRLLNRESDVEGSIDESDIPLKRLKLQMNKSDNSKSALTEETPIVEESAPNIKESASKVVKDTDTSKIKKSAPKIEKRLPNLIKSEPKEEKNTSDTNSNESDCESVKTNTFSLDASAKPEEPKPFNILDHISMIKVNSVGVLYQCKLCNRNFLKKEMILTHGCAKGGVKKGDYAKDPPKPEMPKMPTVKYINTKVNNEPKRPVTISEPINLDDDEEISKPIKPQTTKPRIGPASKVRKNIEVDPPPPKPADLPAPVPQAPVVQFPHAPSINGRYKLVPGPNNTFTLVEEGSESSINVVQNPSKQINPIVPEVVKEIKQPVKTKASKKVNAETPVPPPQAAGQPYPVGLFQTVPHNSNSTPVDPPTFTTPAMKKQSYTIVQTGNPNKLLISTKTQPEEVPPKKKPKKSKHETASEEPSSKEPFSVTLEDAARPQDSGFFTFINVDPLLQPSYVLPTDSIIQESQITTTNNVNKKSAQDIDKDNMKYSCNMCDLKFAREKKLLTHIQSHYNQMDQEDEIRNAKKRTRSKK